MANPPLEAKPHDRIQKHTCLSHRGWRAAIEVVFEDTKTASSEIDERMTLQLWLFDEKESEGGNKRAMAL